MMAYTERKHMTFVCQRCGASYRDLPFYITTELDVICFGCLCEVNPIIALEVIRAAMEEQERAEREVREVDKESSDICPWYEAGKCSYSVDGARYVCNNCGYTC